MEPSENRVAQLEDKVREREAKLTGQPVGAVAPARREWRWFVGIYADLPDFDEVVRIGQEWRNADRPQDEDRESE